MGDTRQRWLLYHWTSKAALDSIKKEGLIPQRGQHCKDIKDSTEGVVFLCLEVNIDFWRKCFYDAEVLLSLSLDADFIHRNMKWRTMKSAPSGMEVASWATIPPEFIHEIKIVDREDFETDRQKYSRKYHLSDVR